MHPPIAPEPSPGPVAGCARAPAAPGRGPRAPLALAAALALAPAAALAEAPVAVAAAATVDKGDVAWMLTATLLVLFMIVPGLALFYGGLVRSKNMLSVLMQCTATTALVIVLWVFWGYSLAFGEEPSAFWGGTGKLFLAGVTAAALAPTFTAGVAIPELLFVAFQMTFACITAALIVGSLAERIRFSALVLFVLLWVSAVYVPVAHMVWDGDGLIFGWGALDFAGGTVVHINAGVAGLVGALLLGPRIGFGRENLAPHSMTLTMAGASMLWVGWFGFNAGSNLEATGGAALAMINTFTAAAGAILAWSAIETLARGKASMLGAASGLVAGLVAVTPAAGYAGPVGAIVLGAAAAAVAYLAVTWMKHALGYDDSLDVFGIHGAGGIIGALGTAIVDRTALGGVGRGAASLADQLLAQALGVGVTVLWSAVASLVLYLVVDTLVGLRVSPEAEREGLDLTAHGERAWNL
ncbi:MAG: ammonium transporter [Rhodobacteraceae bacterium]|nr:ammonium transporter [Paracoccaceae bacterium]